MNRKEGSFTVEAALALPILFFSMMLCVFITQLLLCQNEVQWALTRVARESSVEMAVLENKTMKSTAYFMGKMSLYMKGSGLSISMMNSKVEGDRIDLAASYSVKLPFPIFAIKKVDFYQRVYTRTFVGVESRRVENAVDRTVYVAETGQVYHMDRECTYLRLSISQVCFGDVAQMRNQGGGKYKPCETCAGSSSPAERMKVYVTNYGDRYHLSSSCSRMKRTVYEIKLSEAGKRPSCSKCGKEK